MQAEAPTLRTPALAGYRRNAATLILRYERLASAEKLQPVAHLLPQAPCNVVDIGAGTGVDAAWLALQGHAVLAVEPVGAFREAGKKRHPSPRIAWLDDSLPALAGTRALEVNFRLALACAVWADVPPPQRAQALASIAALLEPGGTLIMSLRQGPAAASLSPFPVSVEGTMELARSQGLQPVFRCEAPPEPAHGGAPATGWTWLAFTRE